MNKEVFEKLKKNIRSSFALWEPADIRNPKEVRVPSVLKDYESCEKRLKPGIIFTGMNLADDGAAGQIAPFLNFHSEATKHNDYRLRDAIVGTVFEGAYMTDLFKLHTPAGSSVEKYYKENPGEAEKAVLEFVEECRMVEPGRKVIICVGSGIHYNTLLKFFSSHRAGYEDFIFEFKDPGAQERIAAKKNLFYIPHYSGAAGKTDVQYNQEARELLSRVEYSVWGTAATASEIKPVLKEAVEEETAVRKTEAIEKTAKPLLRKEACAKDGKQKQAVIDSIVMENRKFKEEFDLNETGYHTQGYISYLQGAKEVWDAFSDRYELRVYKPGKVRNGGCGGVSIYQDGDNLATITIGRDASLYVHDDNVRIATGEKYGQDPSGHYRIANTSVEKCIEVLEKAL